MADTDFKSSLPVRSESDGSDERLHVKIVDGTNPAVNQATVDSDKNLHVLAEGHDPSGAAQPVRTSELGAITPDGIYDATNNTKPGNVGVIASVRDIAPSDATQAIRITGKNGSTDTTVWAMDVSLHDQNGNTYTDTNPLPVVLSDTPSGWSDVAESEDALNIAASGSANIDYTVTSGKTLELHKVMCSASGRMRFELQTSPDGSTFTRIMVKYNSTADANIEFDFNPCDIDIVGSGSKVRVVVLNLDHQPFDAHACFIGFEH